MSQQEILEIEQAFHEDRLIIQQNLQKLSESKEEIKDYNSSEVVDIRSMIKENRNKWRDLNSKNSPLTSLYYNFLNDIVHECIGKFNLILPNLQDLEAKLLMIRMLADSYRYLTEINSNCNLKKEEYLNKSLTCYKQAMEISESLPIENVSRLGVILNYSVLLADEMHKVYDAIELLESTIEKLNSFIENFDSASIGTDLEVYQSFKSIMCENVTYYKDNAEYY